MLHRTVAADTVAVVLASLVVVAVAATARTVRVEGTLKISLLLQLLWLAGAKVAAAGSLWLRCCVQWLCGGFKCDCVVVDELAYLWLLLQHSLM